MRKDDESAAPTQLPLVMTVGDGQGVFCGEALDGEAHAIPAPVIAEEDPTGTNEIPPGDEVGIDVLLLMAAVDVDEVGFHAVDRAPLGGGDGGDRKGRDPGLVAGAGDVGEEGVVERGVAVTQVQRTVAGGVVEVLPHLQCTEPGIDADDFRIEAEPFEVTGQRERGTAFPSADLDDPLGPEFFDQLAEGRGVGAPTGGVVGPNGGIEIGVGIDLVKHGADPPGVVARHVETLRAPEPAKAEAAPVGKGFEEALEVFFHEGGAVDGRMIRETANGHESARIGTRNRPAGMVFVRLLAVMPRPVRGFAFLSRAWERSELRGTRRDWG